MSAPNTNVEKQTKRHIGALGGMGIAVAVAAALFLAFLAWSFVQSDESSEGVPVTVDAVDG